MIYYQFSHCDWEFYRIKFNKLIFKRVRKIAKSNY